MAPDPLLIDRVLSIPIVAAGMPDGRRLAKMWEYTHLPLDQQLDMGGWHCLLGACLGRTMAPALAMAAQQTMRIRCHSWKHIRHVWAAVRLHPANLNTSTISRRDRLASSSNRPSYRCTAGVRGVEIDVHADPEGGLYSAAAGLRLAGVNGYRNDSELFEPGFKVGPLRFGLQYGWNTVPSGENVDVECWHGTYQRGHFCKPEHNVAACKFGADTPRCLRVLQAGGWEGRRPIQPARCQLLRLLPRCCLGALNAAMPCPQLRYHPSPSHANCRSFMCRTLTLAPPVSPSAAASAPSRAGQVGGGQGVAGQRLEKGCIRRDGERVKRQEMRGKHQESGEPSLCEDQPQPAYSPAKLPFNGHSDHLSGSPPPP